jgi:transcriptional regulator with XRE-family HTH domain
MPSSPTVAQRRLARALRRLRVNADLTIEQMAEKVDLSASTLSRLETAQATVRRGDVRELLDVYEVTGRQRDELLLLAMLSRRPPWWQEFRDLPQAAVADLEAQAASIRQYSALLVPGLLQTEAYAREVLGALLGGARPEDVERLVKLRMGRQRVLTEEKSPHYVVVLDEAVLLRAIGGRHVMHAQLERLIETSPLANVTIRVLPLAGGAHAGMDGDFTIFSFREPEDPDTVYDDPDVVYTDDLEGGRYIEDRDTTKRYGEAFAQLLGTALDPAKSAQTLAARERQLQGPERG